MGVKELAEARRARLAAAAEATAPTLHPYADLAPDIDPPERSAEDTDLDRFLDGIGIVDAYVKWCGKTPNPNAKRRESIMVRCPWPDHPDEDPSAWLNSDNDLGMCGCGRGFDKYMIAGWHFGIDPKSKEFPKLRREMAEAFGHRVVTTSLGKEVVVAAPDPTPVVTTPIAPVLSLVPAAAVTAVEYPSIDWRAIVPEGTFLRGWLEYRCNDDLPEEYHFWLGLQAIGLAAGRTLMLCDDPPVRANLFVCLYGPSGIGKTRAVNAVATLLREALPWEADDELGLGVYIVPTPGSGEALIDSFVNLHMEATPGATPSSPKVIPVRGLVRFDELSELIGKANRMGSTLKSKLMEFYDGSHPIGTNSRSARNVEAREHFAAATTTTQPGAVQILLQQHDADSGFCNRWVFVSGPIKEPLDWGGLALDVSAHVDPLRRIRKFAFESDDIVMSDPAAAAAWRAFHRGTLVPMLIGDDGDDVLLKRAQLTLKKLILLFCLNEHLKVPTAELIDRVTSLYPYLQASYSLLASQIGRGPFESCRVELLEFAIEHEKQTGIAPTLKELSKSTKHSHDLVWSVIKVMLNLNQLQEKAQPSGPSRYTAATA